MTESEWLVCENIQAMLDFLRGKCSQRKIRLFGCACCRRIWHLLPSDICKQAVKDAECYAEGLMREEERREAVMSALEAYVFSAAAAEVALQGTWNPLDCLAAEHERGQWEDKFATACEEARKMPCDPCEAWVSREAAHATYYALLLEDDLLRHVNYHAASAVTFFYEEDGWEAYCKRGGISDETYAQRRVFDDIFGNPFCSSSLPARSVLAWKDGTVCRIAQTIYEERRLPEGTLDTTRLAILADTLLDAGCDDENLIQHCRSEGPHVRGCWAVDLLLGKESRR